MHSDGRCDSCGRLFHLRAIPQKRILMCVSSFVVTLPDDSMQANAIQNAIKALPVFEPGDAIGAQLPVVLETENGTVARY